MTADRDLADLADLCGVFDRFRDLSGVTRSTSPDTQRALLRANGLSVGSAAETRETLDRLRAEQQEFPIAREVVLNCDQPISVPCRRALEWQLTLEGAAQVFCEGRAQEHVDLPPLPIGVHKLQMAWDKAEGQSTLVVTPDRAPALEKATGAGQTWGVVAALYGLRSARNSGLGDFEDLARLAEALGPAGAGFLGINPVHALGWAAQDVISPYSPTHRGFLNTAHLALDQLPGSGPSSFFAHEAAELIDYSEHGRQHRADLRARFAAFQQNATVADRRALQQFTEAGGDALVDFARFEELSEQQGPDWRRWPRSLKSPDEARPSQVSPGMAFHVWLQWLADQQLQDAHRRARQGGMSLGLYLDLAVGARLDGAEAWAAADSLATGVSLGAPPDHLSPAGQNWQLAAYAPRKLSEQHYAPLRQILRQAMRHCGLLRIDHALGLNRSYWIPEDGSPGGYIRQPFQALMGIIAIEAHRAGTLVIGEDLGLVPDGFRDTLASKGFYGYTVLQYEKTSTGAFRDATDVRSQSLACFGTHDTPTIAGFWNGTDIGWWHKLNWIDDAERARAEERRVREKADLLQSGSRGLDGRTADDLRNAVHHDLAKGAAALVAVQLDDVLGVREAQNLPGTIDEHPNWRRRSPVAVEDLAGHADVEATAQVMAKAGRGQSKRPI